ncbi:MAG: family 16 glycosylhydrolase [Polyangiales bacterium]
MTHAMSAMLTVCAALTLCLTAYSLGHYLCAVLFVLGRPKLRVFDGRPDDAVGVLVAARNERERALRVITSVLEQDHSGPIEIYVLLKDSTDSSIPYFQAQYPHLDFQCAAPSTIQVIHSAHRRAFVVYTGVDPKSEKINWMANQLTTKYVAILDCDHQAQPSWIRSSICLLKERAAQIVQGRREPISAHGFFQLWDSLHQHVGCELFNAAFSKVNFTVFFTGTTTVMETSLLTGRPLSHCITEDIDFSYDISLNGVKIISNPHSGSNEETSPDLYSFLARRRRWSNGHTEAFLKHLRMLRAAPVRFLDRLQFLFHGSHYLVSLVVFALHLLIGIFFFGHLSRLSQAAALLSGLTLAAMTARTQRTVGWRPRLAEVAVIFLWMCPAIVILMNFVQAILVGDITRAALPIPHAIQAVGLIGLFAPLIVLLIGLVGFRQLSLVTLFAVVLTYPVAFYLDISGILLGLSDYVTGHARWRVVSRAEPPIFVGVSDPSRLLPTASIRESWTLANLLHTQRAEARPSLPTPRRAPGWLYASLLLALFGGGALYAPSTALKVASARCSTLPSDTDPWIVPAKRMPGYCDGSSAPPEQWGQRTGTFRLLRSDDLISVDPNFWDRLDTTFFCNKAVFSPDNVVPIAGGGIRLKLEPRAIGGKDFSSGSIATKDAVDAKFTFGRFETVLRPTKVSGVVTGVFLYRFDPWQEIDAEFVGKDTTKLVVNVFYNPGEEGDLYNYGLRGTPVTIDLGFDAAADFHRYAIEWEKEEIRWFVDDRLVHARAAGSPTPIPHLPMRFHINTWPCCSEELAGPFTPTSEPMGTEVKSISLWRWYPSPQDRVVPFLRSLVSSSRSSKDWRKSATWIQP